MPENLNTIQASFNEEFCSYLEYHLTRTFANASQKEIKWLWCDGIKVPSIGNQLFVKNVIERKQITTEAWIGINGQDTFNITIKFGTRSLGKFIEGLNLNDCLPNEESLEWIKLDIDKKELELQLA